MATQAALEDGVKKGVVDRVARVFDSLVTDVASSTVSDSDAKKQFQDQIDAIRESITIANEIVGAPTSGGGSA